MELRDLRKREALLIKTITLRITLDDLKFLKRNKISPTKLFRGSIENIKRELKGPVGPDASNN